MPNPFCLCFLFFNRGPVAVVSVWPLGIVVFHKGVHALSKVPFRSIDTSIQLLSLQDREEGFHDRIVIRTARVGEGLPNPAILQQLPKCHRGILRTLVTVEQQAAGSSSLFERRFKSGCDQLRGFIWETLYSITLREYRSRMAQM